MTQLDDEYFDLYKSIDNILKDAYQTNEGMKLYAETMEFKYNSNPGVCDRICNWKDYYKMLFRLKAVRNRMSHDNGDSFASEEDYEKLLAFKERLLNGNDPLALLRKQEQNNNYRSQNYTNSARSNTQSIQNSYPANYSQNANQSKSNNVGGIVLGIAVAILSFIIIKFVIL